MTSLNSSSIIRGNRMLALLVLVGLFIASSCGVPIDRPRVTWSAEVRSPDGNWLATANSREGGGFGGQYDVTQVYLNSTTLGTPIEILGFSHEQPTMTLKMEWLTSTHLNVSYGGHANLNFQAIKCAGIDISVQNLSDGTNVSIP